MPHSHEPPNFSLHPSSLKRPPFDSNHGLFDDLGTNSSFGADPDTLNPRDGQPALLSLAMPACFTESYGTFNERVSTLSMQNVREYFCADLDMRRYDKVHRYLWFASRYNIAEALHQQALLFELIAVTENVDHHLVCSGRRLCIKPLPEYLLCYSIWKFYLCQNDELYASALGLLRSYFHLVRSKSDLRIAHQNALLPIEVTWQQWTSFTQNAFPSFDHGACHPRYWHGVLGAWRLTWILRLCPETRSFTGLGSRWMKTPYSPANYVLESTKWLVGSLIYVTIVLTAMQVGLATDRLKGDETFQRVSSGFTVFSILAPLIGLFVVFGLTLFRSLDIEYRLLQRRPRDSN